MPKKQAKNKCIKCQWRDSKSRNIDYCEQSDLGYCKEYPENSMVAVDIVVTARFGRPHKDACTVRKCTTSLEYKGPVSDCVDSIADRIDKTVEKLKKDMEK